METMNKKRYFMYAVWAFILVFALMAIFSFNEPQEKTVIRTSESRQIPAGTELTLTAVPDSGWVFAHWKGSISGNENPIVITVDSDLEVVAVFFRVYQVEIGVEGNGVIDVDIAIDNIDN
jgi:hypothetical protein